MNKKGITIRLDDGKEVFIKQKYLALADEKAGMEPMDSVFFQRQLEYIEAQTYDHLYPELEARSCFGVDTSGGPAVTSLTYRSFNFAGKAKVINAKATDLPKPNIKGVEVTIPVRTVGVSYDYTVSEVNAAIHTGLPLEARKAMAATRGYEQFVNNATWYGDKESGIVGFFQNPDITQADAAPGKDGSTEWTKKEPKEILADLAGVVSTMYASTLKIMKPDEIWLPVERHQYIMNLPRSDQSDKTVLQYFTDNNQFINSRDKVKGLNALAGMGKNGTECMVVVAKSANGLPTFRLREPFPLTWLPLQLHNMTWEIPGYGRFAGFQAMYPDAITIVSGI